MNLNEIFLVSMLKCFCPQAREEVRHARAHAVRGRCGGGAAAAGAGRRGAGGELAGAAVAAVAVHARAAVQQPARGRGVGAAPRVQLQPQLRAQHHLQPRLPAAGGGRAPGQQALPERGSAARRGGAAGSRGQQHQRRPAPGGLA